MAHIDTTQRTVRQTIHTHVATHELSRLHWCADATETQSHRNVKEGVANMDAYVMQRLVSNRQADVTRDHQSVRGLRVWLFLDRFGR